MKSFLSLIILIFATGCINLPFFVQTQTIGGGLFLEMRADPQAVFAGSDVRLDIDVDNQNPREIYNVFVNVFDTGYLDIIGTIEGGQTRVALVGKSRCEKNINLMRPNAFSSLTCVLSARSIQQDSLTTTVSASTEYSTDLSFVHIIDIMNEQEYVRRQQQGQLILKPSKYSYSDKNVQIDLEFSEQLPIVVRGKDYFMHITIKNIGNGFIKDIEKGQLSVIRASSIIPKVDDKTIQTPPENVVDCHIDFQGWSIQPIGGKFPKVTCEINLPTGIRVIENYGILINLKYTYETRDSVDVKIIR